MAQQRRPDDQPGHPRQSGQGHHKPARHGQRQRQHRRRGQIQNGREDLRCKRAADLAVGQPVPGHEHRAQQRQQIAFERLAAGGLSAARHTGQSDDQRAGQCKPRARKGTTGRFFMEQKPAEQRHEQRLRAHQCDGCKGAGALERGDPRQVMQRQKQRRQRGEQPLAAAYAQRDALFAHVVDLHWGNEHGGHQHAQKGHRRRRCARAQRALDHGAGIADHAHGKNDQRHGRYLFKHCFLPFGAAFRAGA